MKVHVSNILQKLDVTDRTEAVTLAIQRGILRLD
jgi:DNA-binding NarL/FixJ family response regulator